MDLKGSVALVTGGTKGIGAATAKKLAAAQCEKELAALGFSGRLSARVRELSLKEGVVVDVLGVHHLPVGTHDRDDVGQVELVLGVVGREPAQR